MEIKVLDVDKLVPADWNYKKDDEEKAEKLKNSIIEDDSAGVLAVRKIAEDTWEVIDGNHRLIALKRLGKPNATVEDFGEISKGKAVSISIRRNSNWFPDDSIKLAELLKNDVLIETDLNHLVEIMPYDLKELEAIVNLSDFTFDGFSKPEEDDSGEWRKLIISLSETQLQIVRQALDKVIASEGLENNPDGMALELICADYLANA